MAKNCIIWDNGSSESHTFTDMSPDEFQEAHPDLIIVSCFPTKCDIVRRYNRYEQEWFKYAQDYGINVDNLHKIFVNPVGGEIFEFIGFNKANRKYKFIALNKTTNRRHKLTVGLAQELLAHPYVSTTITT